MNPEHDELEFKIRMDMARMEGEWRAAQIRRQAALEKAIPPPPPPLQDPSYMLVTRGSAPDGFALFLILLPIVLVIIAAR